MVKELENNKKESSLKFLTDFLPLIIFFSVYKLSSHPQPIIPATIFLLITSIITLTIAYLLTKKIAKMPLISAILLGIFGGITIFSGNDMFIKIKPTLLNATFAIILFTGYFMKKPLLSYLFEGAIEMSNKAWLNFSLRWAFLFSILAILNELIWRNFSTDFWVQFKVFGMLPISIIFALINIPFLLKNSKNSPK
jgi:intracellular septation protein